MAYKLTLSTLVAGLEPENIKRLATFKYFSTLSTPVTELVMRTALEAGQFQNYTDAGWLATMTDLAATPFEDSALTAGEYSIINTIREVVSPDPSNDCCGIVAPTDGNTSITAIERVGSATFEHAIDFFMDSDTDCNVKSVLITLTAGGGAPPLTSDNPFRVLFDKCTGTSRVFKYLWTTYAIDPTAGEYTVTMDFRDADDTSIDIIVSGTKLIMP